MEVEDTDNLALDERKEIEDCVSEALDENYDNHTNIAIATTTRLPTRRKSLRTRTLKTPKIPRLARTSVSMKMLKRLRFSSPPTWSCLGRC